MFNFWAISSAAEVSSSSAGEIFTSVSVRLHPLLWRVHLEPLLDGNSD